MQKSKKELTWFGMTSILSSDTEQTTGTFVLSLVNNFKTAMEDVTNSLNGQISQINGLLAQARD